MPGFALVLFGFVVLGLVSLALRQETGCRNVSEMTCFVCSVTSSVNSVNFSFTAQSNSQDFNSVNDKLTTVNQNKRDTDLQILS